MQVSDHSLYFFCYSSGFEGGLGMGMPATKGTLSICKVGSC
jgi:hypothetical protein